MTTVRIAARRAALDTRPDGSTAIRHTSWSWPTIRPPAMGLWLPAAGPMSAVADPGPAARDGEAGPAAAAYPPGDLPDQGFEPRGSGRPNCWARLAAAVTGVDIDELGLTCWRRGIGVASPAGTRQVTAPPGSAWPWRPRWRCRFGTPTP